MNKPWVGFLSSALLLAAGVVYIAGERMGLGVLFIVLALASIALNVFIYRRRSK